jgi:hypothetical protein
MAVLQITDSAGSVGEIDLRISTKGSKAGKWTCLSPTGAFSNRITLDDWQDATVEWSTNLRDEYVGTVYCYLDDWGDGNPATCLELDNIFSNGIHDPGSEGTGTIMLTREGVMTNGNITWKFLRHSGAELYESRN